MLGDGDHAERTRGERIADHLDDLHPRAIRAAHAFGDHQLACLGLATVSDGGGLAHALVYGREPCLAGLVDLDHAHQAFGARRKLLHRDRHPARVSLLGAGKDAVAALQCRRAFRAPHLGLAHDQTRGIPGGFGVPIVGLGDQITVLNGDDLQRRHLGHPAHAVKGAFRAVDQPFFGHVLEQSLQLDLLLPLQPEGLRDLALAGGNVGGLDEVEHLSGRRHPLGELGRFGHASPLPDEFRHCEEPLGDAAIHGRTCDLPEGAIHGLLRSARNDEVHSFATGSKAPPGTALETGEQNVPAHAATPNIQSSPRSFLTCLNTRPSATATALAASEPSM